MDTKETIISELIEKWVDFTDGGWFDIKDIYRDIGVEDRRGRVNVAVILKRLKDRGKVIPHDKKHGIYRKTKEDLVESMWKEADPMNTLKLKWVFELENYINLYPKSVVIVAGSFNAGKSALMFNFIKDNQADHDIIYFNSEMGPEELKVRLSKFPLEYSEWNFRCFERSSNFSDVIFPDSINLIDYLEVTENFYAIGEEITAILNKLKTGIAIIALQKKRGVELGRGGEFSAEKPRLYLSIDGGFPGQFSKLKIIKAKNWVDSETNPNGMTLSFKLVGGWHFLREEETV